jgi:hypothetical protein
MIWGGGSHVGYPAPHPQGNQLVTYPKAKPAWNIAPSSSRYAGPVGGHLHKWVTLPTTHRVTNLCALTLRLPSAQGNRIVTSPEAKPAWNPALSSSRYVGPVGGHLHKWVTLLTTTYRVTGMCALTFGLPSPQGNPEVRPSHFGYPGDQTCHRPEQI